jgi:steroid delta-isomerase-like uncharacterized protein
MTTQAIVLEYYAAFDRGDVAQLVSMLAADFRAYLPGEADPLRRENFAAFATTFLVGFPDIKHTFEDVMVDGDGLRPTGGHRVVTRGYFTGTHRGSFQGLPPTGRSVQVNFIHIDRVENGQLVEHWGQADLAAIFAQLGITPIPLMAIDRAIKFRLGL